MNTYTLDVIPAMNTYTFDVIPASDGTDDTLLQLTEEFCKNEDWREGDVIEWVDLKDGSYQLINKTKESRK